MENSLQYLYATKQALNSISLEELFTFTENLIKCKKRIFVMGNGGSASISNHWVCDHMKGINEDTSLLEKPVVISLSSNIELITAIANDISYEEIFSRQLKYYRPNKNEDCLVSVSVSGNSPNVIKALEYANENEIETFSISGKNKGRAYELAKYKISIPSNNYGIVEDISMMILHSVSQQIRWKHTDKADIKL